MNLDPVTREWKYDFEAFEARISDKTKLVMLTNPNNPTGKMLSQSEIETLTSILNKHPHVYVIADDVYYHLPFHNDLPYKNFAAHGDNWNKTITIYSAGKLFSCTGWKTGWAVGPADLIRHISFVHEGTCFNINVPS
jgi:aspartate/methionine/tyrosine aminotransferase